MSHKKLFATGDLPGIPHLGGGGAREPTDLRHKTNVNRNIKEEHKADPILYQDIPPVMFYPDAPAFPPSFIRIGAECLALPSHAETAHAAHLITVTSAPDTSTPSALGSSKIDSNQAQPTDGQIPSPKPPADPDSDVTYSASFGGSNGNLEYVESVKTYPWDRPTR